MIWRKVKKERIIGFFSLSKSKGQEQWEEENVVENGPKKHLFLGTDQKQEMIKR